MPPMTAFEANLRNVSIDLRAKNPYSYRNNHIRTGASPMAHAKLYTFVMS